MWVCPIISRKLLDHKFRKLNIVTGKVIVYLRQKLMSDLTRWIFHVKKTLINNKIITKPLISKGKINKHRDIKYRKSIIIETQLYLCYKLKIYSYTNNYRINETYIFFLNRRSNLRSRNLLQNLYNKSITLSYIAASNFIYPNRNY